LLLRTDTFLIVCLNSGNCPYLPLDLPESIFDYIRAAEQYKAGMQKLHVRKADFKETPHVSTGE